MEFLEPEDVTSAVAQNGQELNGRMIKISKKRTNLLKYLLADPMGGRGGWLGQSPYFGGRARRFGMQPYASPYSSYGYRPRGRGRGFYAGFQGYQG